MIAARRGSPSPCSTEAAPGPSSCGRPSPCARPLVLLALICLLAAGAIATHEAVAAQLGIAALDSSALALVIEHRAPALTVAAQILAISGGTIGAAVDAVLAVALLSRWRRDAMAAAVLVPAMLGASVITTALKALVGRERPPPELALPPLAVTPSFPSGHTLTATVLMVVLAWEVRRSVDRAWIRGSVAAACALWAVAMAASRVYLGLHWLSDVIAGLLIGAAWALAVIAVSRTGPGAPLRQAPGSRRRQRGPGRIACARAAASTR